MASRSSSMMPSTTRRLSAPAIRRQFGHIAKGRLDEDLDGRAVEPLAKGPQPGRVGRFAGGQHHGPDTLRPVRDQVRRGKFDDPPHAAGTEVVMDDDQFQRAKCHTRPARARTFLNLGFPRLALGFTLKQRNNLCLTSFKPAPLPPCIGWGQPDLPRLERELQEFCRGNTHRTGAALPHQRSRHQGAEADRARTQSMSPTSNRSSWALTAQRGTRQWHKARHFLRAVAAKADAPVERRPADATRFTRSWMTRNSAPAPPARGATCGCASATCWPANRRAWWRCTIATSSLTAANCWPGCATRWRIPSLGFDFCKGYYARVTDQTQWPRHAPDDHPADSCAEEHPRALHPFLVYMDTFRYPLAGEICAGY